MLRISIPLFLALVACVLLLSGQNARGTELLVNGGFEAGVEPWQASHGTLDAAGAPVHSGAGAARLAGTTLQQHEVFQWVEVNPGATYALSAWVLHNDPNVQMAFLRINWYDGDLNPVSTEDSPFPLTAPDPSYRQLTAGPAVAPDAALYARIGLRVQPNGPFTIWVDDISFVGPDPTPIPTASPTIAPTDTPVPTLTVSPTPSATPLVTSTPTVTPRRSPTPQPEPIVFPQLVNGDFEEQRSDGTPYGWRKVGGEMASVSLPRRDGSHAVSLTSDTTSTKWVYQTVSVQGDQFYEATAYALKSDPATREVIIRVSWYESDDGSGESINSVDSLTALGSDSADFRFLTTGPVAAPEEARSAKVRLMLRPQSGAATTVYFDSATFEPVSAPTATFPPKPTSTPTETPVGTPVGTPTISPTSTAGPATPTPPAEPEVFAELTNGGFEVTREDGTPYAWQKYGGAFSSTSDAAAEGALSLELMSTTTSTKWVYQTVTVQPGRFYQASAWTQKYDLNAAATFVRISWYATPDGSGDALDSVDSALALNHDPSFVMLSTGPVLAPPGAVTAKVKLMLRPQSDSRTVAYFDRVAFAAVDPPSSSAPPSETPATRPPEMSAPPATSDQEPSSFASLTNGSFEELRDDGTPRAWHAFGGDLASGTTASDGSRSLALSSDTTSTKWAYQAVAVEAGRFYEAKVDVLPQANVASVYVRLSWYESPDGTGESLDQVDSNVAAKTGAFETLTTQPVQAPAGAHSVRVRLMLRPASGSHAAAIFDDVTFSLTGVPLSDPAAPPEVDGTIPGSPTAAVLGVLATPVKPVNDRSAPDDENAVEPTSNRGSDYDWVLALAIGMPAAALGTAGLLEWRKRRRDTGRLR